MMAAMRKTMRVMRRTRTLSMAVGLSVALTVAPTRAAEPLPSLDELLALYKDLGLPLPPADAKLVRYEYESGGPVGGKTQRKTYYRLAFQTKPADGAEGDPEANAKAVAPEPSAAD